MTLETRATVKAAARDLVCWVSLFENPPLLGFRVLKPSLAGLQEGDALRDLQQSEHLAQVMQLSAKQSVIN